MIGLTGWHLLIIVLILVVAAIPLALWIVALVQISGSQASVMATVLWVALVTLVPLLGTIAWLAVGRSSVARGNTTQ